MYRGYNLKLDISSNEYHAIGLQMYDNQQSLIRHELNNYLLPNGAIDGSKLISHWFPQINADIFISHSHKNRDLAITLAGWLKASFDIDSFIDSCIWGYADELIKILDIEYCEFSKGSQTYDYDKRNLTTSHVHMMLGTALNKMIDRTECLFFLNTPQSINPSDAVNRSTTVSPWIYAEIANAMLLKKPLEAHEGRKRLAKSKTFATTRSLTEALNMVIEYPLPTGELADLTFEGLTAWHGIYRQALPKPEKALDTLYEHF